MGAGGKRDGPRCGTARGREKGRSRPFSLAMHIRASPSHAGQRAHSPLGSSASMRTTSRLASARVNAMSSPPALMPSTATSYLPRTLSGHRDGSIPRNVLADTSQRPLLELVPETWGLMRLRWVGARTCRRRRSITCARAHGIAECAARARADQIWPLPVSLVRLTGLPVESALVARGLFAGTAGIGEDDDISLAEQDCAPSACDGARGTRTPDLLGAIQALSQLSYSPAEGDCSARQAGARLTAGRSVRRSSPGRPRRAERPAGGPARAGSPRHR
jgi:hypothetical protein